MSLKLKILPPFGGSQREFFVLRKGMLLVAKVRLRKARIGSTCKSRRFCSKGENRVYVQTICQIKRALFSGNALAVDCVVTDTDKLTARYLNFGIPFVFAKVIGSISEIVFVRRNPRAPEK